MSDTKNARNQGKIDNLIKLGIEEFDSENYEEACDIFKSVLQIDADNAYATFYKGLSLAWDNIHDSSSHFCDATKAAERALAKSFSQSKGSEVYCEFALEVLNRIHSLAMLELDGYYSLRVEQINEFAHAYDKAEGERIAAWREGLSQLAQVCQIERANYADSIKISSANNDREICSIITAACAVVVKALEPIEDVTVIPLELMQKVDICLNGCEIKAGRTYPTFKGTLRYTGDVVKTLLNNLANNYNTAMTSAKELVTDARGIYTEIAKERKAIVVEQYWKVHPKELKELEDKKANFEKQKAEVEKKKRDTDAEYEKEIIGLFEYTKSLKSKLAGLGLFKFKEKKALKEEIAKKDAEREKLISEREEVVDAIECDIMDIDDEIEEINEELTKDR